LAGATALVSARATGVFTDGHQPFWDTARRKAGDRDGTKALTGVLLLHRTLPTEAVLAGIDAAVGWCSLKFGTGSSERVWGTLAQVSLHPRQFRVTGHAPRAACPSRSVDEHPRGEASG
jgi:hypothetical protein